VIHKEINAINITSILEIAKMAAHEKRLKILLVLAQQRMCVCMIADLMDCSYSQSSYHISKLSATGLIEYEKMGNFIIYSLTPFGRTILENMENISSNEVKS